MTKTDTVDNNWENELDKLPRREDGRRELRQFHTAVGSKTKGKSRTSALSRTTTVALAVGNGAVMGALLGSLFGVTSGVVAGAVATVLGFVWIAGSENKDK